MKITEIKSKDNEKIKLARKLGQKKYRDEFSMFCVENLATVYDAVCAGIFPEVLFATKDFVRKNEEKFSFVLKKAKLKEYFLIDEKINKSISDLERASGLVAIFVKRKSKINFSKPIIYLNEINDPGNLGTILRTALAFSLKNIVLDETCADLYNSKTIGAAKDSIFKLNFAFDKDLKILREIKNKMKIFCTRLEDSKDLKLLKKEKVFCIVLGNEARGVSPEIQQAADFFVKINMSKEMESLNVACAAAIIFHEVYMRELT
ncbi:RNA methyltransferase [Patescibacteria group bacterium]|nr:RNA methyltransferase [Patescibacteria group bacterium]